MKIEPAHLTNFQRFWQRISEPDRSVPEHQYLHARLMMIVSLFLTPVILIVTLTTIIFNSPTPPSPFLIVGLAFAILVFGIGGYFLNRRGYHKIVVTVGNYLGSTLLILMAFTLTGTYPQILNYLVLILMFNAFFFSIQSTIPLITYQSVAVILANSLKNPSLSYNSAIRVLIFLWIGFLVISLFARYRNWFEQKRNRIIIQSLENYRAVFDSHVFLIMIHDGRQVIEVNQAAAAVLGYDDPKDLVGKTFADFIYPEDYAMVTQRASQRIQGDAPAPPARYQMRILTRQGAIRWVDSQSRLIQFGGKRATIANAIDVTEQKDMESSLVQRSELDNLLTNISTMFIHLRPEDYDSGINEALALIGATTKADRAYIFQFDDETRQTMSVTHAWYSEKTQNRMDKLQQVPTIRFEWSLAEMETQNGLYIPSVQSLDESNPDKQILLEMDIRAQIEVPMEHGDTRLGLLGINTAQHENIWSEDFVTVLRVIGEILATALDHRRAHIALQKHTRTLEVLNELARIVTASFEPDRVLTEIAKLICETLDATSAYICDWNAKRETITVLADYFSSDATEQERISDVGMIYRLREDFHDSADWLYIASGVRTAHVDSNNLTPESRSHLAQYGGKSMMDVVLSVENQPIGFIEIWESRHRRDFTHDEIALAKAISSQAAGAINRMMLYKALQESERQKAVILDVLPDLIFRIDEDGRYLDLKFTEEHDLAAPPDDIIGKTIHDILPPKIADLAQAMIQRTLETNTVQVFEYELLTVGNTFRQFEARVIRAGNREVLTFVRDITARKEAEARRLELTIERERVKILENFISDASHDLRTPITNLKSRIYLLRKARDAEHQLRQIDVIESEILRLERLIEDLLTMSQLDNNVLEFTLQEIDLNLLLGELVDANLPMAQDGGVRLVLNCDTSARPIICNATEINRLFNNLLSNAINYTPPRGQVTVNTTAKPNGIVIEIKDTGIGIDEKDLPHIFNRFFRADKARSTDMGGTGLGLSIVKKIVELHQGTIEVESTVDRGSTFRVWFPLNPLVPNYHD